MTKKTIATIEKEIMQHPQNREMRKKGYTPIFTASSQSRIVLIGQAPGIRAQESQKPWHDLSGKQLRSWLGVSDEDFYNADKIALIPMDFYFPGAGRSGDLPPRKGFAELWHPQIFALMPHIELTILIGQYAQKYYLQNRKDTLTETVKDYRKYLPQKYLPIPHPSPRNNIWKKKNSWFEKDVVLLLQKHVAKALRS